MGYNLFSQEQDTEESCIKIQLYVVEREKKEGKTSESDVYFVLPRNRFHSRGGLIRAPDCVHSIRREH